jgi:hypothetical protein
VVKDTNYITSLHAGGSKPEPTIFSIEQLVITRKANASREAG